jgi:hypothetical protein
MPGGNFADEEEEKEGKGEGQDEANLRDGDVCLAVATVVADGERRVLLGRWKLVLLPRQLFLVFFFLSVSANLFVCFGWFALCLWWC